MIDYLIIYILGLLTPFIFQRFVMPELKKWIKQKAAKWK